MKHIARKRFGQNFLTDRFVLDDIIAAIAPAPDDVMVEIGPGLGAMTRLLLKSLKQLHVIELDRDLVTRLEKTFNPAQLLIHSGDVLKFDFASIAPKNAPKTAPTEAQADQADQAKQTTESLPQKKLRVVGNLPYNISSPLLFHLTDYTLLIEDQHFMLQKEVVERMVAAPGSKAYGRLSVMLQWRYKMELQFIVPPSAFDPPPKVESAIVRMRPLAQPLPCDVEKLEAVVLKAFSQRRKVIRNCLAGMFSETQLIDAGIDPGDRAEVVPLEKFVLLANRLPS